MLREQFRNRAFRESCCHHFIEYVLKFSIAGLFLLFLSLSLLSLSLFARVLFSWLFLKNSLFPLLKNELEDIARQIARVVEYTHAEEKDSFFVCDAKSKRAALQQTETKKNKFGSPEGNTRTKKEKREKNPLQKAPLFLLNSLSKRRRKKERDERRRVAPRGGKSSRDGKYVVSSSLSRAARTFSFLIYIRKKKTSALIYILAEKKIVRQRYSPSLSVFTTFKQHQQQQQQNFQHYQHGQMSPGNHVPTNQHWGNNSVGENTFFPTSPNSLARAGLGAYGEKLVSSGSNFMQRYFTSEGIRVYFDVTETYCFHKIRLVLCPFLARGSWARVSENVHSVGTRYKPPRSDVHAPDLFIPFCSYWTYVLLCCFRQSFIFSNFTPDSVAKHAWWASLAWFCHWLFLVISLRSCGAGNTASSLDILSYTGYTFLLASCGLFAKSIKGWFGWTSIAWGSLASSIFIVKTMKRITFSEARNRASQNNGGSGYNSTGGYSQSKGTNYVFLVAACVQFPLQLFLISRMKRMQFNKNKNNFCTRETNIGALVGVIVATLKRRGIYYFCF